MRRGDIEPLGWRSQPVAHPVRTGIGLLAPALAVTALATHIVWERSSSADWPAEVSLVAVFCAFVTSAWAILVAVSRPFQIVAVAALIMSVLTAALWWQALIQIVRSS